MVFKIENFCQEHNQEFKIYYNYLQNSYYVSILLQYMRIIHIKEIKKKIMEMIEKNHLIVLDKLNKIDIIISFYKQNNLINKSEIGKFFGFYENERNKINIQNKNDLFNLFYKMIDYKNIIDMLKECFYIFSDYRACIYYMTPSIDFYNCSKKEIDTVVNSFKDNTNTLIQIISKIYVGDKYNPWGSPYYASAYAFFETLFILKKYYKNPLEKIGIKVTIQEKNNNIIQSLYDAYNLKKMKDDKISDKIKTVSQFIICLKKMGYDLWFVIPFVFDTIYTKYEINNLSDGHIFNGKNIYYQKMNNEIGLKCFLLVENGYITNTNIFKRFNAID